MRTAPFSLITMDDSEAARAVLDRLGLLEPDEAIESMSRAGEGNMNLVLRVATNQRSVIVKQSRPWVEKYPQIDAPADRILAEIDFYLRIARYPTIRSRMPKMLGYDRDHRVLVLEDLGRATDYSDLYALGDPDAMPLQEAIDWLAELHRIEIEPTTRSTIGSFPLRKLNHAHLFVIPLQSPSAISLDAVCGGLEDLAESVRNSQRLQVAAARLGDRYLGTGNHLLHGDFYPGSWLRTDSGLRIIDPEFTFAGPAEFDLAVLSAHRVFIGGGIDCTNVVHCHYQAASDESIDMDLLRGFAALEIIRRLIGVAQLPLEADLNRRSDMINVAQSWLDP